MAHVRMPKPNLSFCVEFGPRVGENFGLMSMVAVTNPTQAYSDVHKRGDPNVDPKTQQPYGPQKCP